MQIKRWLCVLGLVAVATASLAAINPKFLRAPSASLGSPRVIINWTEIGLGDVEVVQYKATAMAAARYQCVNRGNNCPAASNKQDVLAEVSLKFESGVTNGRVTDTTILQAPASTLVCPSGQVVGLVSVLFTDITLEDTTNGVVSRTNPDWLKYPGTECP